MYFSNCAKFDIMDLNGVIEVLGGDIYAKRAVDLLVKYCDIGIIPAKEIDDEELIMLLEYYKLALPFNSINSSLSWNFRIILHENLEIPYIVRAFFKELKLKETNPEDVIVNYFKEIGERNPEEFVEIFRELISYSKNCIVDGDRIVKVSSKYKRDGGVVIAELKGSGLISPYIRIIRKLKSPLYELNRFFVKLLNSGTR